MPDTFFSLSRNVKNELIQIASEQLDRRQIQLEKDIWVVQVLKILFSSEFSEHLVFKGGTSLSKVYKVIQRFSEDVDVTVDINRLIPDKTVDSEFPPTASQAKKWKERIQDVELPKFIENEMSPQLIANLPDGIVLTPDEDDSGTIYVDYTALAVATESGSIDSRSYIDSRVKIELGGVSSGNPNHRAEIECDTSFLEQVGGIELPRATVRVMDIQRTFWEKATLTHIASIRGQNKWAGYARHWHDLAKIYDSEFWDLCLGDLETAHLVANVKQHFYNYRVGGVEISYADAVNGGIRIVPDGENLVLLQEDYDEMQKEDMFEEDPDSFEQLITKCKEIENSLNSRNLG